MTQRPSSNVVLLFLFPVVALISCGYAGGDVLRSNFDCTSSIPKQLPSSSTCSWGLDRFPEEFEKCRDSGNTTCYFFISEPPFISTFVRNDVKDPVEVQRPFVCGEFKNAFGGKAKFSGITFKTLLRTSAADDLCMYTGNSCEFNDLVDFIQLKASEGYRFAITGYLLETPPRQCQHEASVPVSDDVMVIIGRRDTKRLTSAIERLFKPFHLGSWLIFVFTFISFLIVCFIISWKLHVNKTSSIGDGLQLLLGQRGSTQLEDDIRATKGDAVARSIAARNGIVTSLLRVSIGASVIIFVLFYEVAVVNVLFSERTPILSQKISRLTVAELKEYGVLKNSALENVWASEVDTSAPEIQVDDPSTYPWVGCLTGSECKELLDQGKIQFMVSFGTEARDILSNESNCERYAVFETKDALYQFNAGWLYNTAVDTERRKEVDRQLLALRINGELEELFTEELGRETCDGKPDNTIAPLTILMPVLVVVFPPLIGALLVLFFWKKIDARSGMNKVAGNASDASDSKSSIEENNSV